MHGLPPIQINPQPALTTTQISATEKVVVADDFLLDPRGLIDYAAAQAAQFFVPEAGYPGHNLLLDDGVVRDMRRFLLHRMGREFGFCRGGAHVAIGLSMVTFPPEQLGNFQRLCHTDPRDTQGRRKFASVLYLFDDERLGGTAFYRWKKPEVIEHALAMEMRDPVATTALLAEHCRDFREPPRYITQTNELADQLAVIPPRFNRAIFYSGEVPHTGHITAPELLSPDFRRGRLTLNCFASVVPA